MCKKFEIRDVGEFIYKNQLVMILDRQKKALNLISAKRFHLFIIPQLRNAIWVHYTMMGVD